MTSNEFRAVMGYKPIDDPKANELRNKHLNISNQELEPQMTTESVEEEAPVSDESQEPRLF